MNGANTDPNMPESIEPPAEVVVYICPTEGCGNYFAAPDFRQDRADIESMQYHRSQNDGTQVASHPRVECPDCRLREDRHVNRIPYVVTQVVPLGKVLTYRRLRDEAAKKAAEGQTSAASAVQ